MSQAERVLFEQLKNYFQQYGQYGQTQPNENAKTICAEFEQRLAEAEKDKARIDWLEEQLKYAAYVTDVGESLHIWPGRGKIRAQIDAALTTPLPESNKNE